MLAEIVYETAGAEHIDCREVICSSGIVMVAMDGEDRERDVEIRVKVVCSASDKVGSLVSQDLERDRFVSHASLVDDLHSLDHGRSRGLVLMKEVAAQDDHVDTQVSCRG